MAGGRPRARLAREELKKEEGLPECDPRAKVVRPGEVEVHLGAFPGRDGRQGEPARQECFALDLYRPTHVYALERGKIFLVADPHPAREGMLGARLYILEELRALAQDRFLASVGEDEPVADEVEVARDVAEVTSVLPVLFARPWRRAAPGAGRPSKASMP